MESTTEQPNIKDMRNALKQSRGTGSSNMKASATIFDFMMDMMQLSPKQGKPKGLIKPVDKRKKPTGAR